MDALASALIGAQIGRLQMAVAAKLLQINAQTAASAVKVIDAAEKNLDRLADVAVGIGTNLDITV